MHLCSNMATSGRSADINGSSAPPPYDPNGVTTCTKQTSYLLTSSPLLTFTFSPLALLSSARGHSTSLALALCLSYLPCALCLSLAISLSLVLSLSLSLSHSLSSSLLISRYLLLSLSLFLSLSLSLSPPPGESRRGVNHQNCREKAW